MLNHLQQNLIKIGSITSRAKPGTILAPFRMSDNNDEGSLTKGSLVDESSSSQSLTTEVPDPESTNSEGAPSDVATSGKRPGTKRGRDGKKWVGFNWEQKQFLIKKCQYFHVMSIPVSDNFKSWEDASQ